MYGSSLVIVLTYPRIVGPRVMSLAIAPQIPLRRSAFEARNKMPLQILLQTYIRKCCDGGGHCVERRLKVVNRISVESRDVARKISRLESRYKAALSISNEDEGKAFAEQIRRQSLEADTVIGSRCGERTRCRIRNGILGWRRTARVLTTSARQGPVLYQAARTYSVLQRRVAGRTRIES